MNYFEYHGSSIWYERREILKKAIFCDDNIKTFCYENRGNNFVKFEEITSRKFVFQGKLYQFLTDLSGQISSFFELNMSKEKCLKNNFGVYYAFLIEQEN
jgi:hypothetical protein